MSELPYRRIPGGFAGRESAFVVVAQGLQAWQIGCEYFTGTGHKMVICPRHDFYDLPELFKPLLVNAVPLHQVFAQALGGPDAELRGRG